MDRLKFVEKNIELATKVAHSGIHRQHRVGAVLTSGGNVISLGANNAKTHPIMRGFKTLHGEVAALIGTRWKDISGSIVFVSRINGNGRVGLAKPCPTCQTILKEYGVRKAYYTVGDGTIGELKLS